MRRRAVAVLLFAALVFLPYAAAAAQEVQAGASGSPAGEGSVSQAGAAGGRTMVGIDQAQLQEMENNAGYMERLAAGLVLGLPKFLVRVLHLQDPLVLVFQEVPQNLPPELRPANWVPPDQMYFYTFQPGEFAAVARIYDTLEGYLPISLTVMLVFAAAVLFAAGFTAERRSGAKSVLLGIAVAVLAARLGPYLMGIAFDLNRALVLAFRSTFADLAPVSFFDLLWREDTKSLGMAIVVFITAMTMGVLNWQYNMRKLVLGVLIFSFPLVCVVSVIPSRRGALEIWLREFLANVFLQAAHAAVYAFFVLFITTTPGQFGAFWTTIAFLLGLDGLSEVLRRLVGAQTLSGTGAGLIGGALGLGSVFAIGRLTLVGARGSAGGGPGGAAAAFSGLSAAAAAAGAEGAGGAAAFGSVRPAGWGGWALRGLGIGARVAAGAAAPVAVLGGTVAGAMIGGAAAGEADLGAEFGLAAGSTFAGRAWDAAGRARDTLYSVADEQAATGESIGSIAGRRLGLYGGAQWLDPGAMARVGRAFGGLPGMAAAGGAGLVARGFSYLGANWHGFGSKARELTAGVEAYRADAYRRLGEAREEMARLMPEYNLARQRLDLVKAEKGTDTDEYFQARADYDRVAARMAQLKMKEIHAQQDLSFEKVRARYAELRAAQRRGLSGTTADEVGWRTP